MKLRGFEVSKYKNENLELPRRATKHAAGYDLSVAENITIKPGETAGFRQD